MEAARNTTENVLTEVGDERAAQDEKWGVQNHSPSRWVAILGEEFGETAKEAVEVEAATTHGAVWARLDAMRDEAIQAAAVAVAIVEWIDRGAPVDG